MVLVKSAWSLEDDLGTRFYAKEDSSLDTNMKDMMMFDDFEIAMKVVIVGNGSVGKSSMIQRFCRGIFTRDYKKTIGVDFLERVMTIDDQSVRLMLWDTAGQEEFDAITRTYYRGANACVLACSVTDKESFLALPKWKNKVCRECGDIPMVLVANKLDLQKQAVVDSAELEGMARSLGIPKLFKTSVKDDLNVNCVFTFLSTAYVQSVLSQSSLEEDSLAIPNGHLDDTDDIDLVLNHRLNAPLFGGKSNKSKSNNAAVITDSKGLLSKSNSNGVSNKANKGKNLFKNPVILKSASTNLTNHNNQNSSSNNNRGFFSSNKKQNNHNQQNSHQNQHYNFLKGSSNSSSTNGAMNGKGGSYANGNGMAVSIGDGGGNGYVHHTHHHHQPRNGQILPQNYRHHNSYTHYVNGGLSVDPTRWSDTNVPFRLDLVNGKKRKRDPCTIL